MKYLGLSFAAGLVGALGFAPIGLWPLAIISLGVLLWLVDRAPNLRSALARGWWFGFGQFALGLNWIATAFTYQAAMPAWLGWVAVILLSLYLAVYPAAAAGLAWRWGRRNALVFVLLFAAAWIVTEWLRGTLFTGFPWNPVGVSLIETIFSWPAPWIGTYGLSGLAVLLAGVLMLIHRDDQRRSGAAVALAIFAFCATAWAVAAAAPDGQPGGAVRIVQPNIGQQNKWDPGFREENFRRQQRLTGAPLAEPRLVLWPEAATPDFIGVDRGARARIAGLIGPRDLILLGAVELVFGPTGVTDAAYNSLFALDANGRIVGRYDKAHLVPYGEYLPMRPFLSTLGISRLAPGDKDFLSGPGPRNIDLPGFGTAGIQICYEIIFSGDVVSDSERPDFIFNPSNDAWFGAWGPPQHLAQARLRALEEGLPVLRATPTGISAVIDDQGRLLHALPSGVEGVIDARLPPAGAATLFARFGNALPFLFAIMLVAGAVAVRRKTG
ncbi:MAG TPA: apolipoprotein N-acyltransferase [Allosphingosinicella sp.]|nr:apolipoprotein N-acyltransferase [Allosphingosinicella sp.]